MSGISNLNELLQHASPELNPGKFVFCTLEAPSSELNKLAVVTVREKEGMTLVLPQQVADRHNIAYEYVAGWITLKIHSSLAAVGLTAAFSSALAAKGISCNVVAGYYHDHIFVAQDDTPSAMAVLSALKPEASA